MYPIIRSLALNIFFQKLWKNYSNKHSMHFFKLMNKSQCMKIKFCFLEIIFFNELFNLLFNLLFSTKKHIKLFVQNNKIFKSKNFKQKLFLIT